jgi:hypothetical protein
MSVALDVAGVEADEMIGGALTGDSADNGSAVSSDSDASLSSSSSPISRVSEMSQVAEPSSSFVSSMSMGVESMVTAL